MDSAENFESINITWFFGYPRKNIQLLTIVTNLFPRLVRRTTLLVAGVLAGSYRRTSGACVRCGQQRAGELGNGITRENYSRLDEIVNIELFNQM